MAGDIGQAEAGLRIAEQAAPAAATMDLLIHDSASKIIHEGKAAKAAEALKNPGQLLSQQEAKDKVKLVFKEDTIDAAGNLAHSTEQGTRQTDGERLASTVIKCREKGYGGLNNSEKTLIRNTLSDALFNHPAIRTIASSQTPPIDVATPAFRDYCKDAAERFLGNKELGDKMANAVVDILVSKNIDYSSLHQELENYKGLTETVDNLTTEIGTATAGGTPATGLEKEVEDQQALVNKYKTEIVINAATHLPEVKPLAPGPDSRAQMVIDAKARLVDYDKKIALFSNSIKDVDNHFKRNAGAADYTITDPEGTGGASITITRGDWAARKTDWEVKQKDLEVKKNKDGDLIDKINQEEKDVDAKLKELKTKIEKKKADLKNELKKQADSLKKINKARDVNEKDSIANKEQEFIDDLRKIIIDESLNLWAEGHEAIGQAKPEVVKTLEQTVRDEAKKTLREFLYDPVKKEFNKSLLNTELDSLLTGGVDSYGRARLLVLWTACNAPGAPPELQRLKPVISEIVDFTGATPVIKSQEKLREFSSDVVTDMLKMVAYKDPRMLENRFKNDEIAMAKLKGDILPDLIMQAHKDKSLRGELEKSFGEKLTKKSIGDKLKEWKWGQILGILLALGGIAALVAFLSRK